MTRIQAIARRLTGQGEESSSEATKRLARDTEDTISRIHLNRNLLILEMSCKPEIARFFDNAEPPFAGLERDGP